MRRKKTLFAIVCIILYCVILILMLRTCNNNKNTSNVVVSQQWTYDSENHWHEVTKNDVHLYEQDTSPHTFVETEQKTTICTPGVLHKQCTVCGFFIDTEIPAGEHTPSEKWYHNSTTKDAWQVCTVCDEKINQTSHNFSVKDVKQEATCTQKGLIEYLCEQCGTTWEEETDALGHDYLYADNDENHSVTCGRKGCDYTDTQDHIYTGTSSICDKCSHDKYVILITIEDKQSIYGNTLSELTYIITKGAVQQGDDLGITLTKEAGTNVGTYSITGTYTNNLYQITFTDGTYSITKRTASLNWTNTNITYDGSSHVPTATVSNLVGTDTCTVTVTGGQTNAGTSPYTATASELSNSNYQLPTTNTQSFTIAKRAISVKIEDKSSEYGDSLATLTYTVTSGTEIADYKAGISLSKASGTAIDSYTISGSYTNTNYNVTFTNGTYTIGKRTATLSWSNTSFTYDGNSHVPTCTVTNVVSGETCTVTVTGGQTNAGNSYTATASELNNDNYQLPSSKTQSFSIAKRAISVKIEDKSSNYGASLVTLTYTVTSGSEISDHKAGISLSKASGTAAGTYAITGSYSNTTNYTVTFTNGTYTITVVVKCPSCGKTITNYCKHDNYLYFGVYPQTKVSDSTTVTALNNAIDFDNKKPTNGNDNGWTSYKYYQGNDKLGTQSNATDFMWYIDKEYNGNKYRGVYFTSYRPLHTSLLSSKANNTRQDDNGYTTNTIYWFKYEPIKWRILEEGGGYATIFAELILDGQDYYSEYRTDSFSHNGGTGYINNYILSNIRTWLNDTFYNTAFSSLQQALIETVQVDNSARSTNPDNNASYFNSGINNYASDTKTSDKIWLLSEQEVTKASYGFNTDQTSADTARRKTTSDYARCQGVYTESTGTYAGKGYCWWLRSPNCNESHKVWYVYTGCARFADDVCNTNYGVVPALKMKLFDFNTTYLRVDGNDKANTSGNYILFGTYPQTKVSDSTMVTALNNAIDFDNKKPTNGNDNGWTSYKYYQGSGSSGTQSNATDFMWYIDKEYNGNKYRGVYFTSYRPSATFAINSTDYTSQDDNGYTTSDIYWFKYEPIKWRILEEGGGYATILAELILDSQDYYSEYRTDSFSHNGGTGYANDYALSNIRTWLNDTFYNTAFSSLQQALIETVQVDNSARSTNPDNNASYFNSSTNNYASDTKTSDKIWLLSEQEVTKASYGFNTDPANYDTVRRKVTSDYARCQGVYTESTGTYVGKGYWWLRSPCYSGSCNVWVSQVSGNANIYYGDYNTFGGVVPALRMKLFDFNTTYLRVDGNNKANTSGNYILFGTYPQTKVSDSTTVTALNNAIDFDNKKPTNGNNNGWTSYKYYQGNNNYGTQSNATDFMWYIDKEYNGNMYRGVYFTSYRPSFTSNSSSADSTNQDDNGYSTSTIYWFKYELIKWRILEEGDGYATILAELILDSQDYYSEYREDSFSHNDGTGYINNYALSNIRKWLNDTFYNTAFGSLQQALIETVQVDNSARSTNPDNNATQWNNGINDYASDTKTSDKIWLLSEQEVTKASYGFNATQSNTDTVRRKTTSDYARCQGAYTESTGTYAGKGYWWLRSAYQYWSNAWFVYSNGYAGYAKVVSYTEYGVVPALKIKLS